MIKNKEIAIEVDSVRLSSHSVSRGVDPDVKDKILTTYLESGISPPYFKDVSKNLNTDPKKAKDVLMLLVNEGSIIKIKEDLYYHADVINELKNRLMEFLKAHGEITTPQFKELTGASRKYSIPLIEYFDSTNLTIRVGDIRKLRRNTV